MVSLADVLELIQQGKEKARTLWDEVGDNPYLDPRVMAANMGTSPLSPDAIKATGYMGMGMLPGAGIADALGYAPDLAGERMPSLYENLRAGHYMDAGMQTLGAAGDFMLAAGPLAVVAGEAAKAPRAASKAKKFAKNLQQVPDLRGLTVADATRIASKEPHLIPSGNRSEGYFLGGPREIGSKRALTNQRKSFDAYVAADPRGADWYDRYRAGMQQATGGNTLDNLWMSSQEGQWSAGVGPDSELQFTLRENNGSLMGMPVKSARPAQHEAHLAAVAANDPSLYQLGDKTGEYAGLINPDRPGPAGATGVNDFRHARNWRFTEPDGSAQKNGLTEANHTWLDYETALATKRANEKALGARADWTGEKLQAAPWVRQKAMDILDQRPNMVREYIDAGLTPEAAQAAAYEDAFQIANKSITEWFPKHTMNATFEAQPGPATGHLPGSVDAPQVQRDAYALDPRSSWAIAPGGRDGIYAGLRLGDTGVAARVLPSRPMQGYYMGQNGLEQNLGEVGRPLVSFVNGPDGKVIGPADRAMVDAGETLRAAIDGQDAGAAHIAYLGQAPGQSNSFSIPMPGPAGAEQMRTLADIGARYGLPDVADTGGGVTLTRFYPPPDKLGRKQVNAAVDEMTQAGFAGPQRSKVDSVYADLKDAWQQGEGSGAVTRAVLEKINVTPEARAAFDRNPYLAEKAIGNILRDKAMESTWGISRQDLTNFRKIIGAGPGWVDRLENGLKSGVVLPAVAGAVLLEAYRQQGEDPAA